MNKLELDIPLRKLGDIQLSTAKTETTCDFCGHKLGDSYAYDALSVYLPGKSPSATDPIHTYEKGYASSDNRKHFCGMGCMASHLDKCDEEDGIVHDYTDDEKNDHDEDDKTGKKKESHGRYISTKKRNHLKSHQFLDQKRRSFPIENCTDVKAAVHAWGRYKGSMSFDEFKAKLIRKAHELGCSLPASWTEKK